MKLEKIHKDWGIFRTTPEEFRKFGQIFVLLSPREMEGYPELTHTPADSFVKNFSVQTAIDLIDAMEEKGIYLQ